jgi:hypothetical protein
MNKTNESHAAIIQLRVKIVTVIDIRICIEPSILHINPKNLASNNSTKAIKIKSS